jgi:hypothetical protein
VRCGKAFVPKPSTKGRFCSRACYDAAGRPRRKPDMKYRMTTAPDHPIAPPGGVVAVARVMLYDKLGPGPHPCHWCGLALRWVCDGTRPADALFVDHLDFDARNDVPENLVPSCHVCNAHRTRARDHRLIQPGEPVMIVNGQQTRAIERRCERCGQTFLALPAAVKKGKGRFCSRACMWRRNTPL